MFKDKFNFFLTGIILMTNACKEIVSEDSAKKLRDPVQK